MKSKLFIIGMCVLMMLGTVFIIGTTLHEDKQTIAPSTTSTNLIPSIPVERGVFSRSDKALLHQQMPESSNKLSDYYENRAYPGAPPMIPHPLISEKGIGGKICLQCHENGGYAAQFQAFAPITPHPELLNCKQCHLPKKTDSFFKSTDWQKTAASDIQQVAMPSAPPMIPHDLDMRSNCLSCHANPAAPKEIRVSHPERVNCRQCHLPKNTLEIFSKPTPTVSVFTRPKAGNE